MRLIQREAILLNLLQWTSAFYDRMIEYRWIKVVALKGIEILKSPIFDAVLERIKERVSKALRQYL